MCTAFLEANIKAPVHNKNMYCLRLNNYISVCLICKMMHIITINNVQRFSLIGKLGNNLNSPKLVNSDTNY